MQLIAPAGEQGISAVLADRMPLFSKGMSRLLTVEYGIHIVAVCDDFDLAIATIRRTSPLIAVLDRDLMWADLRRSIRTVRLCSPRTKLLITQSQACDGDVLLALAAGASRCISKRASIQTMRTLMDRVIGTFLETPIAAW